MIFSVHIPDTVDMEYPDTFDMEYPDTFDMEYPDTFDMEYPDTFDMEYPDTFDVEYPDTFDMEYPNTLEHTGHSSLWIEGLTETNLSDTRLWGNAGHLDLEYQWIRVVVDDIQLDDIIYQASIYMNNSHVINRP